MPGGVDANLITAITHLVQVAGVWGTCAIITAFTLPPVLVARFISKQKDKATDAIINTKEREIQRLADENREWRTHFFSLAGMSPEKIAAMQGPSPAAKPLLASAKQGAAGGLMQPPPDVDIHQGAKGDEIHPEKPKGSTGAKKKGDRK